MTGGSDDHGSFRDSGLGREVTPPESYERISPWRPGTRPPGGPAGGRPQQAMSPGELPPDIVPPQIFPEE